MQALKRFLSDKARAWALARQGEDDTVVTLTTRRVYILPTRQGLAFGVLLLAMLLASLNYNNSLGLALTFLLGGLAVVAMHHCHHNMVGLTVRYQGVEPVFAGQRAEFRFALETRPRLSRYQFDLQTEAPHQPEASPETVLSHIVDVSAEQPTEVPLSVPTLTRGTCTLPRVGIATRFPFGLFRAWSWLHMDCRLIVFPAPAADAPAVQSGDGDGGGRWDERRGQEDFAGLRTFREGDSPRHIAWKAYARDEEPRVKHYAGLAVSSTWLDFAALSSPDPEQRLSQLTRQILDAEAAGTPYGLRLPRDVAIAPGLGAAHRTRCLTALALCEVGSGAGAASARPVPTGHRSADGAAADDGIAA